MSAAGPTAPERKSHPARGGWIEIAHQPVWVRRVCRPTPQGVGGLKYVVRRIDGQTPVSHPARGGWIEILLLYLMVQSKMSHPARGGWIEILNLEEWFPSFLSHPARGGWIEIKRRGNPCVCHCPSHPARGGWIEMRPLCADWGRISSHPARGGWIERKCGIFRRKVVYQSYLLRIGGLKSQRAYRSGRRIGCASKRKYLSRRPVNHYIANELFLKYYRFTINIYCKTINIVVY